MVLRNMGEFPGMAKLMVAASDCNVSADIFFECLAQHIALAAAVA